MTFLAASFWPDLSLNASGKKGSAVSDTHDVRCDVVMLQEIAEDVAEQPVSAAGVEWLVELSACIIQTNLMH